MYKTLPSWHFSISFRSMQTVPHYFKMQFTIIKLLVKHTKPHRSADLRTGCRFISRLGQYYFQGLMIVIATGLISLSPLSVMWESSQWLGKNTVRSTG